MNLDQENACKTLRGFSSAKAVEWLMENYSFESGKAGEAYLIIPHRSWLKADQLKLADYYLGNLPHRSDRGYKPFLKFMARHLPDDPGQRALIAYHLKPVLDSHPDRIKFQSLVSDFLNALN
jgi:hypothetical protein